jgi:hypothetical protein
MMSLCVVTLSVISWYDELIIWSRVLSIFEFERDEIERDEFGCDEVEQENIEQEKFE